VLCRACLRSLNELLQSPRALKALVAAGSVLSLLLVALLLAPSLVRGRLEREARERGFEARAGAVRFGASGVWVKDVRVTSSGDSLELALDAVNIGVFSGRVRAFGGNLRGRGDVEPILKKLRGKATNGAAAKESSRELSLEGLHVSWQRDDSSVEVWGLHAKRSGGEQALGADLVRAKLGKSSLEARDVAVGMTSSEGHRRLVELRTTSVDLAWVSEAPAAPPGTAAPAPREPPLGEEPGRARAQKLRELRALLLPMLRDGLARDARLGLDGVSARIERSGEMLSFGPSRLSLQRDGDGLRVSLTPNATEAGVTPLELNVSTPLAVAPVHVIAKGGPVSFASLGIRPGQMGLADARQATLAADGVADFAEDLESVQIKGKLAVRGLVVQRRELSPQPVGPWGFDVALEAKARLDGEELEIASSEAHIGELRAELSGHVANAPGKRHVEGRLRVPLSGCQSMLEAAPRGLLPLVRDMRLSGSFGIDLQVRYDALAPKDTRVVLTVQNECKVESVPPELSAQRFARPFMRQVKAPDGSLVTVESGPGSPSWVFIDDMSRHLETAVLICEDSRFHAHAGFDFLALENALKDDLKQGRFARGASTVTMQLAKNLYLSMEKNLGRKLQEALLTVLLEQQLDKRQIMELYLNVVELGPGLYGVGDAAQYYFATPARSLSLGQSLYLASILPNPTYSRFGPDGKLKPQWQSYLRRLMQIAHKIKRIDDSELQAALEEEIAFRVPPSPEAAGSAPAPDEAPDERGPPELDEAGAP
jgi:penicillin-binding protein 1A